MLLRESGRNSGHGREKTDWTPAIKRGVRSAKKAQIGRRTVSDLVCRNKRRGCYAPLPRFTSAGNADSSRGLAIWKAGVAKTGEKVADCGTAEKCRVLRGVATQKIRKNGGKNANTEG